MSKNIINLSSKVKKILEDINKLISNKDKDDITTKKISYKRLTEIYNSINDILNRNEDFDINNLLMNYKKENETINLIKNIVLLRNEKIMILAEKSILWKQTIDKLYELTNKKIKKEKLTDEFKKLLSNYNNNWNSYWKNIVIDNKGKIIDINIIDIDDINKITSVKN